jgi:hypothetical protein
MDRRALAAAGLLLAASLACGSRGQPGIEATVDAVNTAVEMTLAAMTPGGPASATAPAPPASETPPGAPTSAPLPSDTSAPPSSEPPTAVPTAAELARPNGAVLTAAHRDAPPILDGQQDDWPADLPYSIDQIVYNPTSWTGTGDQVGRFNVMWDASNLYFFVVVDDDVHAQEDSGETLYRGDSLELQFDADLAGDFSSTELNGDDYQIGLSPGASRESPEIYFWNPRDRRGQPTGITLTTHARGDNAGYVAELAVPWTLFGVTPAPGSRFGLALNSSDNDSPGTREQQSMISSVITRRLLDPTSWGTLALDG